MSAEILIGDYLSQIEKCLTHDLFMVAVTTTLTIPDFAGGIDFPTKGNKKRYVDWFEKYAEKRFYYYGKQWLTAADCYQLRCAILHRAIPNDGKGSQYAEILIARMERNTSPVGVLEFNESTLWIDPQTFCHNMIYSAYDWLEQVHDSANFKENADNFFQTYTIRFS